MKTKEKVMTATEFKAKYPDWTPDAESVLTMLGTAGIAECRRIEREVAA